MLRALGTLMVTAWLVTACGGGDGAPPPPPPPPPRAVALAYGYSAYVEVGSPVGPWAPTVSGGSATGFAVAPVLPTGLALDPNTGVIGGRPQAGAALTTYRVSAQIAGSSTGSDLTFAVLTPPSQLSYPNPVRAQVGTALTPLVPAVSGDTGFYSISPSLPGGLQIDGGTGVVSGTPTDVRVAATYTVVASNLLSSTTSADVVLAVDPPATGTPMTGYFRAATVIGLGYESGAHAGVTDGSGQFTYESGRGIGFHVGAVALGTAASARPLLTPVDLVAGGTGSAEPVLNRVRFLMMLDQDGDPRNGIQISAAVTAAAANWTPVDFSTHDLPAALGAVIKQATAADGGSHALPDATAAQAFLRAAFACAYAGEYRGRYAADATPHTHGSIVVVVVPDGSMAVFASGTAGLADFSTAAADAVNPLLDGSVAVIAPGSSLTVHGAFPDPGFLAGTYLAGAAGTFEAVNDTVFGPTYLLFDAIVGTPGDPATAVFSYRAPLVMDSSGAVAGSLPGGYLTGVVAGATFTGTVAVGSGRNGGHVSRYPVSGTVANTPFGYEIDAQYTGQGGTVVAFTTLGCRVN